MKQSIDNFIEHHILAPLDVSSLSEIHANDKKVVLAKLIYYFELKGYNINDLKNSNYNDDIFIFIKNNFDDNLLKNKELKRLNKSALIKELIKLKEKATEELLNLIEDLNNNAFDKEIFKFLQTYQSIANKVVFRFLIEPLLNKQTCSKNIMNTLTSPILKAGKDKNKIFSIYEQYYQTYDQYENKIDVNNKYDIIFYKPIHDYLSRLFKSVCKINPKLTSEIKLENTPRKYNFNSRKSTDIFFYISNSGEGIAKQINLTFTSKSLNFPKSNISINTLQKEQIEIKVNSLITQPLKRPVEIVIKSNWKEINGDTREAVYSLALEEQEIKDIHWEEIIKEKPYSISIIEERKKLFGRNEILDSLIENSNSQNIESFILYGQKRVGKSSIVKSLKTELDKQEDIVAVYKSMGNLKAVDPLDTFNHLGAYLCDEIIEELLIKYEHDKEKYDSISQLEIPDFKGSLAPLEGFIKRIRRNNRRLKFIFILDEFDELNQDFFKPGIIGETFSINIGKGLNDFKYIGFILVGSENMAFLNWQGMRYNNFREVRVDIFDKSNQYSPFKRIVTDPLAPNIKYSDSAIDLIYEYSNGNPYFTNLICEKAFQTAYKHKDIYIDKHDIEQAISNFIDTEGKGRFEHFWSDGINTETTTNKDKTSDIRKRILLAFSIAKSKDDKRVTKEVIVKYIPKPKEYEISQLEFDRVLQEFYNRGIFCKNNNHTIIRPKIFQEWLCDRGKNLLVEGVADLDSIIREQELEHELYINNEEIGNFIDKIKYKDKRLKNNDIRVYLNQFGKNSIQRKAFYLLNNLQYTSSYEIQSFFRRIQKQIFEAKEISLKENARKLKRDNVSICLFSNYFHENESIANSFKLHSNIDSRKKNYNLKDDVVVLSKLDDETIVIIEPIIENISFFKEELEKFMFRVNSGVNLSVSIVCLIITTKAKSELSRFLRKSVNVTINLIPYKTFDDNAIMPYVESNQIFEDYEETNSNYSAIRSIFPSLSKDSLLILFESFCPCRSIPILWKSTQEFSPLFANGCTTRVEIEKSNDEENRLRAYKINTELSQKMNKYIVDNLKEKSNNGQWLDVKIVPPKVIKKVNERWVDEGQKNNQESYLDFIDYKEIIKKHSDLNKVFSIKGENLSWLDKLNLLRREPAHPEKPAPKIEDVEYFEEIANKIISKIS
jgi:hypothetical protein